MQVAAVLKLRALCSAENQVNTRIRPNGSAHGSDLWARPRTKVKGSARHNSKVNTALPEMDLQDSTFPCVYLSCSQIPPVE